MATRRPTDRADEENESTAFDLGRNLVSATRKPVAPAPRRTSVQSAEPAPRAPAPPGPAPMHPSDAADPEDTDYIAVRPSSAKPASGAPSHGSPPQGANGEEDTEFLVERPTGQTLSLKAMSQAQGSPEREMRGLAPSKRVVALGEERSGPRAPAPASAEPPRAPPPRGAHRPVSAEDEDDVTEPPQRAPVIRGSAKSAQQPEDNTDPPVSMPRVTRFFVAATASKKPKDFDVVSQTDPGDDADSEPDSAAPSGAPAVPQTQHRPLPARADMSAAPLRPVTIVASPNPFKREPSLTRSSGPITAPHTLDGDSAPADGLLVVEVPAGAVVFVNGEERGAGPQVRVEGLHRYQRHSIKVRAPGHLRWSGSVSLEGRNAAKVRPSLKKK
jgi:hypothetical protein